MIIFRSDLSRLDSVCSFSRSGSLELNRVALSRVRLYRVVLSRVVLSLSRVALSRIVLIRAVLSRVLLIRVVLSRIVFSRISLNAKRQNSNQMPFSLVSIDRRINKTKKKKKLKSKSPFLPFNFRTVQVNWWNIGRRCIRVCPNLYQYLHRAGICCEDYWQNTWPCKGSSFPWSRNLSSLSRTSRYPSTHWIFWRWG